jgi:tetratricopeptide (TPR) repeat protein
MATSVQWARPLDERTTQHATDYASRSARHALLRGEAGIAIRIARQLAMAQPGVEAHQLLLAEALAARDAASDFIARNADASDADTVNRLAAAHLTLGDLIAASQLWLSLARADPTHADAFVSFGWCMARAGNFDVAAQIADRVAGLADHPKVDALRMIVALAAGDHASALAHALHARDLPQAFAWLPHGAVFEQTGVVTAASLALGFKLDDLGAVLHLYEVGQALQDGRQDDAIRLADQVLGAIPDDRWAAMFKIMALVAKEDKMGAVQAQAALAAASGARLDVLTRLVDLLFEVSAHQQVLDLGAVVRERLPHHFSLMSTISHSAAHMAEMDLADEMIAALQPLGVTIGKTGLSPFIVMTMTDDPALHRLAAEQRAGILPGPQEPLATPLPAPPGPERLRVGYFSNDFHNHATMKLLIEALEATDRTRFELFASAAVP